MTDQALNDEDVTNDAIFTVFWSLGLPKELCYKLVFWRWNDYSGIEKFEEMRHHELSGHYPKNLQTKEIFKMSERKALADIIKKWADKDNSFFEYMGVASNQTPQAHSNLNNWQLVIPMEKKKIDLSLIVGSSIDVEFCYGKDFSKWNIGRLIKILDNSFYPNPTTDINPSKFCRIRENYWHSWDGGAFILPDGLDVILKFRNNDTVSSPEYQAYKWDWHTVPLHDFDVISFKVVGVADGWEYKNE